MKTIYLKCKVCGYAITIKRKLNNEDIYCKKCGSFMSEPDLFEE
jgi:uncharacterized Zn finger protein